MEINIETNRSQRMVFTLLAAGRARFCPDHTGPSMMIKLPGMVPRNENKELGNLQ